MCLAFLRYIHCSLFLTVIRIFPLLSKSAIQYLLRNQHSYVFNFSSMGSVDLGIVSVQIPLFHNFLPIQNICNGQCIMKKTNILKIILHCFTILCSFWKYKKSFRSEGTLVGPYNILELQNLVWSMWYPVNSDVYQMQYSQTLPFTNTYMWIRLKQ